MVLFFLFFFLNLIAKNFKKKTESDWIKPNWSHSVLKKDAIRTSEAKGKR